MPVFNQIISHGSLSSALIIDRRFRRVANDLDEADFSVLTDSDSSYNRGDVIEGWRVREVDTVQEGSGAYEHRLSCRGIIGSKATKLVSGGLPKISLESWDTCEAEYISANPYYLRAGEALAGYPNLICVEALPAQIDPEWNLYRVSGSFKGLVSPKPMKRVVTVNGNVYSGESIRVPLAGGWTDYRRGSVLFPNIACTFSWMSIGLRSYALPTQGGSPPGPLPQVIVPRFTGDGLMSHWPNGWRREGITEDQLPGTLITFNQETWAYQAQFTP